jgi:deoxyribonuclease V
MKIPPVPHSWRLTPKRAVALQRELAGRVRAEALSRPPRLLAGVDCAFEDERCLAVAVLWDARTGETLEQHSADRALNFPYVPGLLSFREAPAVLAALRKLRTTPDAILCDGHGIAHPRRFGIACHIGILTDRPTLGVAKSRLVGVHREPGPKRGSRASLEHEGERIGTVLRTRDGVRPVYVSIGHRIDLPGATRIVLAAATGFRLPEPTRLADRGVARFKQERRLRREASSPAAR